MVDTPTPQQDDKPLEGPLPSSADLDTNNTPKPQAPTPPPVPGVPSDDSSGKQSATGQAPSVPTPPAAPKPPQQPPNPPTANPTDPKTTKESSPQASRSQINPALGTEPKVPGGPEGSGEPGDGPAASANLSQAVSSRETPTPNAFSPKRPETPFNPTTQDPVPASAPVPAPGGGPVEPTGGPAGPTAGAGGVPPAGGPIPPITPKKRSRLWLWITIIIVVLLILAGLAYFFFFRSTTPTTTEAPSVTEEETETEVPAADSDEDADGLNYAQEQLLGSDPEKTDTDGDGYDDGEEFENGYNPAPGDELLTQELIDQVNALASTTTENEPNITGEELETVYAGEGSYRCAITGLNSDGTANVVTLEIKEGKYRGEFTRVVDGQDVKLAYIVDGQTVYFGNVDEEKYVELTYDPVTGEGVSEDLNGNGVPEFSIKGFIFTSESLLLESNPTEVECTSVDLPDSRFTISADKIIEISEASASDIEPTN